MSGENNNGANNAMKVANSCAIQENKTVFSSSAQYPGFLGSENESIASKLKDAVGRVSEKLHTTLHNATEKVKNILVEGETPVNERIEMESNNKQKNENADLKRQSSESGASVDNSLGE